MIHVYIDKEKFWVHSLKDRRVPRLGQNIGQRIVRIIAYGTEGLNLAIHFKRVN